MQEYLVSVIQLVEWNPEYCSEFIAVEVNLIERFEKLLDEHSRTFTAIFVATIAVVTHPSYKG